MKKIWSANTKRVNGKTLANVDIVMNIVNVERDYNLFDFIKYYSIAGRYSKRTFKIQKRM